jgi:tetratricopeptide (TPR) repeat protein
LTRWSTPCRQAGSDSAAESRQRDLGDRQQAVAYIHRGIERYRSIGDHFNETEALIRLGDFWQTTGDVERARSAWREALEIRERTGGFDLEKLRAKLDQSAAAVSQLPAAGTRQP